ncbi:hypothetical protein LUZ60_001264 [Juncus effusus]|nr:hypothetical protein LUZ60_001264 [Juncus effusus]
MYKEELENMFPIKDSVFHHLGRYLLQPANPVWELIERYYETYLANVDERIGLQVRIFSQDNVTFEKMFDRILECSKNTNLLPELGPPNHTNSIYDSRKRKAILVVSLFSYYYEKIKSMYYENSTVTGEKVGVYQPSHEQKEKFNIKSHAKALAEIFLLSYCDKIATTSWSTFGYVSYSLAGVRPWIIRSPGWMQAGLDGACVRPESVEPCSHSSPTLKCDGKVDLNVTKLVPFVRSCEDVPGGLKVFS